MTDDIQDNKLDTEETVKIKPQSNKISMNYKLANDATIAVFKLCKEIDNELITKNILDPIP